MEELLFVNLYQVKLNIIALPQLIPILNLFIFIIIITIIIIIILYKLITLSTNTNNLLKSVSQK